MPFNVPTTSCSSAGVEALRRKKVFITLASYSLRFPSAATKMAVGDMGRQKVFDSSASIFNASGTITSFNSTVTFCGL